MKLKQTLDDFSWSFMGEAFISFLSFKIHILSVLQLDSDLSCFSSNLSLDWTNPTQVKDWTNNFKPIQIFKFE